MPKVTLRIFVTVLQVMILSSCSLSQNSQFPSTISPSDPSSVVYNNLHQGVVSNELLIYLNEGTDPSVLQAIASEIHAEITGSVPEILLYQVRFDNPDHSVAVLDSKKLLIQEKESVRFAYYNTIVEYLRVPREWSEPVSPNKSNWGFVVTNMLKAWEFIYGFNYQSLLTLSNDYPAIAIVDSVFNEKHPEISGRAELIQYGTSTDGQCNAQESKDHGNHVTGIAAATGDNALAVDGGGMVGVNWKSKIKLYPTKRWDTTKGGCPITTNVNTSGMTNLAISAEAVVRAAKDPSVKVINYSQGFNWYSRGLYFSNPPLPLNRSIANCKIANISPEVNPQLTLDCDRQMWQPVLSYVKNNHKLIIAAAGNNSGLDSNGRYVQVDSKWSGGPQALANEFDNIIVVGSVGNGDANKDYTQWEAPWTNLSKFSSIGPDVHIVAPGAAIRSLSYDNGYVFVSGTSQAAPFVTGVASLIWAINPGFSETEVRRIIDNGAQAGGMRSTGNNPMSYPILDAYQSLVSAVGSPPPRNLRLPTDLTWHRTYDFTRKDTCSTCTDTVGDPSGKCAQPGFEIIYQKKVTISEKASLRKANYQCVTNQREGYDTCFKNYMCNWSGNNEIPDRCYNVVDKKDLTDDIAIAQLPACTIIPGVGMRVQLPPGIPGTDGYDLGFWPIEPVRPAFKIGSAMYAYAQYFIPGPTSPGFRLGADCTPSIDPNHGIVEQHTDGSRHGTWHELMMPIVNPPVGDFSKVLSSNPNCTAWAQCLNSNLWPPYDGDGKGGSCILSRVELGGYRETCDLENGRIEVEIDDCPGCLLSHGFDSSGWVADAPGQTTGATTLWRINDSSLLMNLCQKKIPLNIRIPAIPPMINDNWLAIGIGYYDSVSMQWKETGAQITKNARIRVYKNGALSDTKVLDCSTAGHNPSPILYGYQIQVMLMPNAKMQSARDPKEVFDCMN